MNQSVSAPHYHAGSNVAGYIPEGDIALFSDRASAIAYSKGEADRALEEKEDMSDKTEGSLWSLAGDDGDYWLDNDDAHHIPTHFWVNECSNEARECDSCGTLTCIEGVQDYCPECHATFRPANVGR